LRISIIGAGYVGLVTGVCFAELGHEVICIDVVEEKVKAINEGMSSIYEKGLDALLQKHLKGRTFYATNDFYHVKNTDITLVCVGTPRMENGFLDTTYLESAAMDIGQVLAEKDGYHVVTVRSTVLPTTTESIVVPALERTSKKKAGKDFGVAVNPEFLKEGNAIEDFMHPDRIVIGALDDRSLTVLRSLYSTFKCPVVETSLKTAEMIKLASNAFLATKISFINEIGNICKALGIDVREVARGMGYDKRIGPEFLRAGCGFGGSCFPKDTTALASLARSQQIEPIVLDAVIGVNERQPLKMVELLERHIDIQGKTIAVLGLSFKPGTDDIREASSIKIVKALIEKGANIKCHDPKAIENFRREFPTLTYCGTPRECIEDCDAVLIVTEWEEYADPNLYGDKLVIDGRGIVRTKKYDGICW
jgi:UDPglucose 6-dehydrogenase